MRGQVQVVDRGRMLRLTAWYGALAVIGGCLAALALQAVEGLGPETPGMVRWMADAMPIYLPGIAVAMGLLWLKRRGGSVRPVAALLALAAAAGVLALTWGILNR